MKKEDLATFYDSFTGKLPYDSNNKSISKVENFLVGWLDNHDDRQTIVGDMAVLSDVFKKLYPFNGVAYRGLQIAKGKSQDIQSSTLTSFTDMKEVAKYFAGKSKEYGIGTGVNLNHILIETEIKDGFSFDDFLEDLESMTTSKELQNQISERIWEQEKLCGFDASKDKIVNI